MLAHSIEAGTSVLILREMVDDRMCGMWEASVVERARKRRGPEDDEGRSETMMWNSLPYRTTVVEEKTRRHMKRLARHHLVLDALNKSTGDRVRHPLNLVSMAIECASAVRREYDALRADASKPAAPLPTEADIPACLTPPDAPIGPSGDTPASPADVRASSPGGTALPEPDATRAD